MLSKAATYRTNAVLAVGHFAAVVFVAQALAENGGGWAIPVEIAFNTWNETATGTFEIRSSAVRLTDTFYPGYVLLVCSIVSGLHHLVAVRRIDDYYWACGSGFNGYRWLDYSVSASVMLLVNEVLWFAPPDITVLLLTFFVQMFIVLCGGVAVESWWVSPPQRPANIRPWGVLFFSASMLAFALLWARYLYILLQGDDGNVPVFVYGILGMLFVTFSGFPLIFVLKLRGAPADCGRNLHFEAWFWMLSALAKIPLLVFFGTGIVARRASVGVDANRVPTDNEAMEGVLAASIAAAVVILVVGGILGLDSYRHGKQGGFYVFVTQLRVLDM